jgi:hypothetical protein
MEESGVWRKALSSDSVEQTAFYSASSAWWHGGGGGLTERKVLAMKTVTRSHPVQKL